VWRVQAFYLFLGEVIGNDDVGALWEITPDIPSLVRDEP
jgi:hypothetical protein